MSNNLKALLVGLAVGVLAYFLLGYSQQQDRAIVRELERRGEFATQVRVVALPGQSRREPRTPSQREISRHSADYRTYYTVGGMEYWRTGRGGSVVCLPEDPRVARFWEGGKVLGDWDWLPVWGLPLASLIAAFVAYAGTLKLLTRGLDSD